MDRMAKNVYMTNLEYAYSHANPKDEYPSWKPRMFRLRTIGLLLGCILATIGLLEAAARKLPHKSQSKLTSFVDQSTPMIDPVEKKDVHLFPSSSSMSSWYDTPSPITMTPSGSVYPETGGIESSMYSFSLSAYVPDSASYEISGSDSFSTGTFSASKTAYVTQSPSYSVDTGGFYTVSTSSPLPQTFSTTAYVTNSQSYSVDTGGSYAVSPSSPLPPTLSTTAYVTNSQSYILSTSSEASETYQLPASSFVAESQTYSTVTYSHSESIVVADSFSIPTPVTPVASFSIPGHVSFTIQTSDSSDSGTITALPLAGTSSVMSTETLTFTAFASWQNPWYNPDLMPPPKDHLVYMAVVIWPRWAAFMGSGAFAVVALLMMHVFLATFHAQMALVEPFAIMAKTSGAAAKFTIFRNYVSANLLKSIILSIQTCRWIFFLASMATIISTALVPLASEVLVTDTRWCNKSPPNYNQTGPNPCPPQLEVDIHVLRTLQASLILLVILVILVSIHIHRRKTNGSPKDPSSIATVASLLHHPDIMKMLRSIPPNASLREMKRIIGKHRLRLGIYESPEGIWRYGFIPVDHIVSLEVTTEEYRSALKWNETNWYKRLHDLFLLSLLLGLLGVVVAHYKISDPKNNFNKFFNSGHFGVRFVLTTAGSIVKALWHTVFTEVHRKSVFRKLSYGHAKAKATILMKRNLTSISAFFPLLFTGHYFASMVALADILALILVIALPSVSFRSGATKSEYVICSFISIGITGLLVIVLVLVGIWRVRLPMWPREPDNLAALMSYLIDSDLLSHFDREADSNNFGSQLAKETIKTRDWAFDQCVGLDGIVRWTVIEDR